MIYLGTIWDDALESGQQRWIRPSMVMWLNDSDLVHTSPDERDEWYLAAARGKKKVIELLRARGEEFVQRYGDNSREGPRDETWPRWRDNGAAIYRSDMPNSYPGPRWILTRHFAELFDPALQGEALQSAIVAWSDKYMSAAGRMKAMSARELARGEHAVDVRLPGGQHRQLEPGGASLILKGVIEEWAPRKLLAPLVLSISEPGDHVYVVDAARLAAIGITMDAQRVLPDALIVDVGADPVEFWIIEAVNSDGEINDSRKALLLEWAETQGIGAVHCQFLTAFISRNAPPARRRLKDLAEGTFAWFLDEPELELSWGRIEPPVPVRLAPVTQIQ